MDQAREQHSLRTLKKYRESEVLLQRLYRIRPGSFTSLPSLVGFNATVFAPTTGGTRAAGSWGFRSPLNMNAKTFIKRYQNQKRRCIDLSPLVKGAKPNSFVHYLSMRRRMFKNDPPSVSNLIRDVRALRSMAWRFGTPNSLSNALKWQGRSKSVKGVHEFKSAREILELYRVKKSELATLLANDNH